MDTTVMIRRGLEEMDLLVHADAPGRLARYLGLLEKWNRGQNLTSVTAMSDMVTRHVLDSLAGAPWVRGRRILDVGSGAGLPGIPLAIADPSRRVMLLDSRGKRVQFLTYVRHALDLDNVDVVETRFEKYDPAGKFDTLTARAFATLPELVRLAAPFIAAGARLVAWTGGDPSAELAAAPVSRSLSYTVHAVRVPGLAAQRHIAVVEDGG